MSIIIENKLFRCVKTSENVYEIDFGIRTANEIIDVKDYNLFFELKQSKEFHIEHSSFTITGKLTVYAYFIAGYFLTLWGAKNIICRLPSREYEVYLGKETKPEKKIWLTTNENIWSVCENKNTSSGRWNDDVLDRLNIPIDFGESFLSFNHVIFTGRGPVLMYLAMGVSCALYGKGKEIQLSAPSCLFDIVIKNDRIESKYIFGSKNGIVIGILGDPNSGKSVFSKNFYAALSKNLPHNVTIWFYDCDKSAPTPDWYLQHPEPESNETRIRKEIKTPWSQELEKGVQRDLCSLRTRFDLLIADMPGGKHPKAPEERDRAERIPSSS